jgi:SAM-dependent methyltransferase
MRVNLGCGSIYFRANDWLNLDFESKSAAVRACDLTESLPLVGSSAELVYSSHLIEHLERDDGESLLRECWRILKPGGLLRIVTPDLENIALQYLKNYAQGRHDLATVETILLLDQLVRSTPGGYYRAMMTEIRLKNNSDLANYAYQRTGEHPFFDKNEFAHSIVVEDLKKDRRSFVIRKAKRVTSSVKTWWFLFLTSLLPFDIRNSNILYTKPGERHKWIYDFHSLSEILKRIGFTEIKRMTCDSTMFYDTSVTMLDSAIGGQARKGDHSMFLEAVKQTN